MVKKEYLMMLQKGSICWNNWRDKNPDIHPNLEEIDLKNQDLSDFNFSDVSLWGADMENTKLINTRFVRANLQEAKLRRADLRNADLRRSDLTKAELQYAILNDCDLTGANLSRALLNRAILRKAILCKAILDHADFTKADFTGADLFKVQAWSTNFTQVQFTGACLQDWNINEKTVLQDAECQYVYLMRLDKNRFPSSGNFNKGEFIKRFRKIFRVVHLMFNDGIDWGILHTTLQYIQKEQQKKISIKRIEQENENMYSVDINVPLEVRIERFETLFWSEYNKLRENQIHSQQPPPGETYRNNQGIDIMKLFELLMEKNNYSVIVNQKQGDLSLGSKGETIKMTGDRNINIENGNYQENNNPGGDNTQNNNTQPQQSLAQAAGEIQLLLKELEKTYPITNTSEQMTVATKAISYIETNQTLKEKVIKAVKEGGLAAFEKAIDNPAGAFIVAAIKSWQEVKPED